MSFRGRLASFFVLIVIVPMVAAGFLFVQLLDESADGKTDARLATAQHAAGRLFRESRARADVELRRIGADARLAAALEDGDQAAAGRRARALLADGAQRIVLVRGGRAVLDVGRSEATARAGRELVSSSGVRLGELQVSVVTAADYVQRVHELVGVDGVVLQRDGRLLAETLPGAGRVTLPDHGPVEVDGEQLRVATFTAPGFRGAPVRVSVLAGSAFGSRSDGSVVSVLVVLLGFLVLAITFALAVSRSLQQQIATLLHGARRLGAGDLSTRVPTAGGDEFAALGGEFNRMAGELETRLAELDQERARVQHSVRRLGEALGSKLNRKALLEIVVKTAVEGVAATVGRTMTRPAGGGDLHEQLRVGDPRGLHDALTSAEERAVTSGEAHELVLGDVHAMAHPLRESQGARRGIVGVIAVARAGRAFTETQHELFTYLATQAALSLENVELHETVARESVTDELTGVFNRRRFEEGLAEEVERGRRFAHPIGLVLLDIDDFKHVNDTYGHQQGDVVLREVARVLRASCRDIDLPARYGGEEFAVVLPETGLEGAHHLAERVRRGVAALRVELMTGAELQVTVSCGVAALPESAGDEQDLVAAADAALYDAKRAGKDRAVRAHRETPAGSVV